MTGEPTRERPAWVVAEYERIGREREEASRAVARTERRELLRVCLEMIGWVALAFVFYAFSMRTSDEKLGRILFYSGMLVHVGGVLLAISGAYRRAEERGDV